MFRMCRHGRVSTSCASACLRQTRQAIEDFGMAGALNGRRQRWLMALSGGKDSYGLLAAPARSEMARPVADVELIACNLDQGQPNFPKHILPEFLERHGVALSDRISGHLFGGDRQDCRKQHLLFALLAASSRSSLPHRPGGKMRRAGARPSPRGHPGDVLHESSSMAGGLRRCRRSCLNDERDDVLVLRPLAYCAERRSGKICRGFCAFRLFPCDLCGSQDGLQRNAMKEMIADIERRMPGRKETMIRALTNVRPSHLARRSHAERHGKGAWRPHRRSGL